MHQTDKDGSKAGFRKNPDRDWNLRLIGNDWYMGRTEFAPILKEYITPSMVCLQYLHRSTCGTLLKLCKEVYVVIWNRQYSECFLVG